MADLAIGRVHSCGTLTTLAGNYADETLAGQCPYDGAHMQVPNPEYRAPAPDVAALQAENAELKAKLASMKSADAPAATTNPFVATEPIAPDPELPDPETKLVQEIPF